MKARSMLYALTLYVLTLHAADAPPAFKEAAALYDAGQFEQAATRYESLRAAGVASANLYFNLGNACFKAGQLGRAILNYERARRLEPRDPDISGNLRFAINESRAKDTAASSGWSAWLAAARDYRTAGEWTAFATTCYWLVALGAIALLWLPAARKLEPVKRWLRPSVIGFTLLAIVAGTGLITRASVEHGPPEAIVVTKEVVVRFAPVDDAPRHFTAVEGQKLWVTGERASSMVGVPGWVEVERADGNKGWVPANAVERI
ncbi:MAG: tetratricopeptide repeat protein [Verrucomicrobia bacterium]|nr:tetratricopeptide repeat protein [Verrucomicrobiota bacterium]